MQVRDFLGGENVAPGVGILAQEWLIVFAAVGRAIARHPKTWYTTRRTITSTASHSSGSKPSTRRLPVTNRNPGMWGSAVG